MKSRLKIRLVLAASVCAFAHAAIARAYVEDAKTETISKRDAATVSLSEKGDLVMHFVGRNGKIQERSSRMVVHVEAEAETWRKALEQDYFLVLRYECSSRSDNTCRDGDNVEYKRTFWDITAVKKPASPSAKGRGAELRRSAEKIAAVIEMNAAVGFDGRR